MPTDKIIIKIVIFYTFCHNKNAPWPSQMYKEHYVLGKRTRDQEDIMIMSI